MIFILNIVNTPKDELNLDLQFRSMEDLMVAVKALNIEWTSIMISILPGTLQ